MHKPSRPGIIFCLVALWGGMLHAAQPPSSTTVLVGPASEMDPPTVIPVSIGTRESPVIAFNGGVYLAVWVYSLDGEYHSIVGTRITKDGQVLDPGGIAISPNETYVDVRAVASNGTNFLVAWDEGDRLVGILVNADGKVLDRPGFTIIQSTVWNGFRDVKIVSNGSDYLVVSSYDFENGQTGVYAVRVSANGRMLDEDKIFIRDGETAFAAASLNDDYLVAWREYGSGGRIVGRRISSAGEVLDPSPIFLSQGDGESAPSLTAGHGEYFVVWQRGSDIRANRISGAGQILSANDLTLISAWSQELHVLPNDEGYLVAWQTEEGEEEESIQGVRLDHNGIALDTNAIPIAPGLRGENDFGVAGDGHDFFVVWESRPSVYYSLIIGSKVHFDGETPVTDPVQVSRSINVQSDPAVASNGTNYLVVWNDGRDYGVYGSRVSRTGEGIGTTGFRISPAGHGGVSPAVASCAGDYFVIWPALMSGFGGIRVSAVGEVDTNVVEIPVPPGWQLNPQIAANGSNYLIVWEQRTPPDVYTHGDIYGALIAPDGQVLKTNILICTASGLQQEPTVAAHGDQYLVVWDDPRDVGMRHARISGDGAVLDPDGVAIETASIEPQYSPRVCAVPDGYLVLWDQLGDSIRPYTVRLATDGNALDQPGALVTRGYSPVAASDGNRTLAIWMGSSGWSQSSGAHLKEEDGVAWSEPFAINAYVSYSVQGLAAGGNGSFLAVSQSEATDRIVGNLIWLVERPTVQMQSINGETILSWPTEAGRFYRIEFTASLGTPDWNELPGQIVGTGHTVSKIVTSAPDGVQRFYRVTVEVKSE